MQHSWMAAAATGLNGPLVIPPTRGCWMSAIRRPLVVLVIVVGLVLGDLPVVVQVTVCPESPHV